MTDALPEIARELDARGLFCPEPVMLLHNLIADVEVGAVIRILATDPSTQRDFLKFCGFLGHELLLSEASEGEYVYLIQKGEED